MVPIKKAFLLTVSLTFFASIAVAQSNQVIDEILAQESIQYGHAVYLLLSAGGAIDDESSVVDAYGLLESGPENRSNVNYSIGGARFTTTRVPQTAFGYPVDQELTLGEFSRLAMETFGIDGGLMYNLTSRPRYAARELEFRGIVQGDAYPRMSLSGERALRIVGRVLSFEENGTLR